MKKLFLSLALAAFIAPAFAQLEGKPVGGTGPMISVDKDVHDYGTIKQGADGNCQFIVTNTGDQPLIISECKRSCGCTTPKCDTAPIAPGNTSIVQVHYDTNRVGPINKSVTINSNATNAHSKVVNIKGTIEAVEAKSTSTPNVAPPATY